VITLLLLFGLGEGQSCNGGPERQRRHLDLHPDLGRPGYRGGALRLQSDLSHGVFRLRLGEPPTVGGG
jgi:hypothetical protein